MKLVKIEKCIQCHHYCKMSWLCFHPAIDGSLKIGIETARKEIVKECPLPDASQSLFVRRYK
jgi:hypothetical protein